ncbi:MAG: glycosyltransferase family 2 protein [Nitriliruptor sp.]|nr:MAG: glycosyltransferase family 2 protein [Nitriliruptor sp.]
MTAAPSVDPTGPDAVAVVIPARDAAATLPATLDSIRTQEPAPVQIAVAVGPSRDATREVAAAVASTDARISVVDVPSGRTPEALNAAIAATSAPIVARVDAHAVLPPGYLARAVEVLRATGAGNVGGRQVPTAVGGFAAAVAAAMSSPLGAGGAAYRTGQTAGPVDTVYLGVFDRAALEAVGGFDPRFLRNQDAELNLRLARSGYPVWFDPQLAVAYRPRGSVLGLARQYAQYGRYRRLTARTHPGSLRLRQLASPALVAGLATTVGWGLVRRQALLPAVAGAGYLAAVLAGTAATVRPLRRVPAAALATATMHVSWGIGFLLGPPRGSGRAVRVPAATDG